MTKKVSIFVNWDEKDIVTTFSYPGGASKGDKPGRLAEKLYANGYRYIGSVHGFNLSMNILKSNLK